MLFSLSAIGSAWFARKMQVEREEAELLKVVKQDCLGFVIFRSTDSADDPLATESTNYSWQILPNNRLPGVIGICFSPSVPSNDPFALVPRLERFPDEAVRQLKRLPNLNWLSFKSTNVTDEQLAYLEFAPYLETLYLDDCQQITNAGIALLAKAPNLKSLSVSGTGINDDALPHIARLSKLQSLNLENTSIYGVALSELEKCHSLRELNLTGTPACRYGRTAIWRLRENCPKLEISPPHVVCEETGCAPPIDTTIKPHGSRPESQAVDLPDIQIAVPQFLARPLVEFELSPELTQDQIEHFIRGHELGGIACGIGEYKGQSCGFCTRSYWVRLPGFDVKQRVTLDYLEPRDQMPVLKEFKGPGFLYKLGEERQILKKH